MSNQAVVALLTVFVSASAYAAPTTTTSPATLIGPTSAQLNGSVNPNGVSTTAWFRRSTTLVTTCDDSFGTRVPFAGGTGVGNGAAAVSYSVSTTGLLPGTQYWFCAIAEDTAGAKTFGNVLTFTTPAQPPTVDTISATNVTSSGATLEGEVTANGAATTAFFRYHTVNPGSCNATFGTRAPTGTGGASVSGNTLTPYSQMITGLAAGITYYYCAIATNSQGTTFGPVLSFTTLVAVPDVITDLPQSITGTTASLRGQGNPNGSPTTGWFRIAPSDPGTCNDAFGTRVNATSPSSGNLGSGSTYVSFSATATSLMPGTTYWYCAIAQNGVGTSFGTVRTFTTPSPPTVTTQAATSITAFNAVLNATVNPNGSGTAVWFRFSPTNPGTCNDSFGPATSQTSLGATNTPTPVAINTNTVQSLLPGTLYYFCVIASNGVGTSHGTVLTFTTPAVVPTLTTSPATQVTGTTAQLNGSVNPGGAPTTAWFRYSTTSPGTCNDTFGTRVPAAGGTAVAAGNSSVSYLEAISGLTPGTTYYYCAIASSSAGTGVATGTNAVRSFITANVPLVTTGGVSSLTGISATLTGTVDARTGSSTTANATAYFRYSTTNPGTCNDAFGTRAPAMGGTNIPSFNSYSQGITGLTPGTTYYYCALATNIVGTGLGAVLQFTTPSLPAMTTLMPTNVNPTSVTLNGSANPNGATTNVYFRYGTTAAACNTLPSFTSSTNLSGTTTQSYAFSISTVPGTTYYYCAVGDNVVGTGEGTVVQFTTPAQIPAVTTSLVSAITGTTATFNGSASSRGAASVAYFRYATTNPGTCNDTFGVRAPAMGGTMLAAQASSQAFNEMLTGLTPGTTYFVCALAANSVGVGVGGVTSFTTPNVPTVTTNTTSVFSNGTQAQLNGQLFANGATATAYFRYSTMDPGTCNDTFGTRAPTGTSGTVITSSNTFFQTLSGLTPGTTYYACAIGTNIVGTGFGAVVQFTTPAIPTVTTLPATSITATGALLNGSAIPNGAGVTNALGYYRYSTTNPVTCNDTFGTRAPLSVGTGTNLSSGSTSVPFSVNPATLQPGNTYYYCAIASNGVGTGFGTVLSFTTPALAPTVVTSTVTGISSSGATLQGTVNPNGAASTAWFRYSTTSPGTCNDTFGTRVPSGTGGTSIPTGNSSLAFNEVLAGLSLATTYYYCAIAQNSVGLSFGSVVSFTTSPTAPSVTTLAATGITTNTATLNASAVPNGANSTGWFRVWTTMPMSCTDVGGTRLPAMGGTALGNGLSSVPFSVTDTNFQSGVTYYYCAIAQNSAGTSFGALLTFKAASMAPTLTALAASSVGGTSATLNGRANPNGDATTGWYRYSTTNPTTCNDTFGTRVPAAGTSLGSGTTAQDFPQVVTGLTPGVTYYFCAIAQNSVGTSLGLVLSFSTPNAPAVTTNAATPVTATTATINGSAVPNGATATGWFRFSATDPGTCDDTFGTRYPTMGGTTLSGSMAVSFQQAIGGLTPGTQYFYCAIASNSVGVSFGGVLSFFTPPDRPAVTTVTPPTMVTATGATLGGTANPNGAATTGWVRYSTMNPGTCNDTFGTRAPSGTGGSMLGGGTTTVPFTQAVTGLMSGVTYYYCAIAQNAVGTTFGGIQSFTTPGAPLVTTSTPSPIGTTTATLNGSANPNRDGATGWFRYDTTNPGTCNDTFGTRAPAMGGTTLGNGSSGVSFSEAITGLSPGTTYWVCAIASNAIGTSTGVPVSFTTRITPTVVTQAPSVLGSTTATLSATANPNGATTTAWFRWFTVNPGATCVDGGGFRVPSAGGTALGAGTTAVPYTQPITGLSPATSYWGCAFASNSSGVGAGTPVQFTTLAAPVVTALPATMLTTTGATLNAEANPRGAATTGWFRYSTFAPTSCNDTFGIRAPGVGGTMLGSGSMPAPYAQAISGLTQGTTYYWCAIAQNSVGTTFSTVRSFVTPSTPAVTTSAATLVTSTGAQLNGSANPRADATTAWFRYDTVNPGTCNDTFGTRTPPTGGSMVGMGSSAVAYNQAVTGLMPGTQYFFCGIAENSIGTAYGAVLSFTTPTPPTVTTNPATSITASTAVLNGTGVANNAAATGWFRISTTDPGTCNDTFGTRFPAGTGGSALGSGTTSTNFSQTATSLLGNTTYYFCAIAQNVAGTSFGAVRSFTTPAAPTVVANPVTTFTGTTATISATANPNGSTTNGWFRYYTTMPATCTDTGGTRSPSTGSIALGASTTPQPYQANLTGLFSGTTYWFCAIAQNSVGTSFSVPTSFTTAGPPLVTTVAATGVSSSGAQLNGSGTPRGADTTGYFRYGTTFTSTCTSTYGTRFPATGGSMLGNGTAAVTFNEQLAGLAPATTYYYCAVAQSSLGTALGAVMSFTTTAGPAVTTSAATLVTSTTATLNGSANPRSSATTGWFRYSSSNPGSCNDTFGTRAPMAGGTSLGAGSVAVSYSEALTGLTPGTTYYFCAVAQNGVGTSFGAVQTFFTPAAPTVTTNAATGVTSSAASLNASVTPNGATTTAWLRYATTSPGTCDDTFGTRLPSAGGTNLGAGTTAQTLQLTATGLAQGTTYWFCAIASNSIGTSFGTVLSFTTPSAPMVTTTPATAVTSSGATLNGSANPNGLTTNAWFRYSATNPVTCNDTFGTRAPAGTGVALGAGSAPVTFSQAVTGLSPGTTYYFCAISQNPVGVAFGLVLSFTAPAAAPTVTTNQASAVNGSGATLNGSANPGGDATTGWFRYATTQPASCDDTFGTRAPTTGGTTLGAGTTAQPFTQVLTGLTAGTTYWYCAIAQNSVGTSFGGLQSFTVPRPPTVVTQAPSAITSTAATLNGSVNPNFAATTAWFRFSATQPAMCNDTFGIRTPPTGGTMVAAGGAPSMYSQQVTGLQAGTTYWVCAIASNAAGTAFGALQQFRTPGRPTVTTSSATNVMAGMARLNGTVNPNGAQTTGWFRYATTTPGTCNDSFGTRAPAASGMALGSGTTDIGWSQDIAGLTPGQTYFFCAIAQNSVGLGFGQVQSFMVEAPAPVVTTEPATDVVARGATFNGRASPMGTQTIGWFRYDTTDPGACSDTFGTRVPSTGGVTIGSGIAVLPFDLAVTDLKPNTQYFYCALASNVGGAAMGSVQSFRTPAATPVVQTVSAMPEADGSVTVNGLGNPSGSDTQAWFQFGPENPGTCSETFGQKTTGDNVALGSGTDSVTFSKNISGVPEGTYYFCAVAANDAGTVYGEVLQFTIVGGSGGGCGCGVGAPFPAVLLMLAWVARRRRRNS